VHADIRFHGFDLEVLVSTADGVMPLDWLSHGTTTLLGWAGVLLPQLFDQGGESPDPTRWISIYILLPNRLSFLN
jgi:hypothetical protein